MPLLGSVVTHDAAQGTLFPWMPRARRRKWGQTDIEVTLDPYRYPEHQRAMQETCRRFNAAQVRWRDGRLLRMRLAEGA